MGEVLGEGLRAAGQGDTVVLLVKADSYFEVLQKLDDDLVLCSPTQFCHRSALEMEAEGYRARPALKIIKPNGTLMYVCKTPPEDVYCAGKCTRAPQEKRHGR